MKRKHHENIKCPNNDLYSLRDINQLYNKDIIHKTPEGWFLNLHSPYDSEIEPEWKNKIIGCKSFENAELHAINDSFIGAIYILGYKEKKALFTLHHYHDMMGGCYFSPDEDPFMYSNIKVYADMDKWNNYGYAACEMNGLWKLIKVTQFPMPCYAIVGEGFVSAEEAMKSIGIDDCTKYLS